MDNLEKVKIWCKKNGVTYIEEIEVGTIYMEKRIIKENGVRGNSYTESIFKVLEFTDLEMEQFLNYLKGCLFKNE